MRTTNTPGSALTEESSKKTMIIVVKISVTTISTVCGKIDTKSSARMELIKNLDQFENKN